MKKLTTLTLSAIMFTSVACAQAPVLTTVKSDGKNIFSGVKLENKGMEPET